MALLYLKKNVKKDTFLSKYFFNKVRPNNVVPIKRYTYFEINSLIFSRTISKTFLCTPVCIHISLRHMFSNKCFIKAACQNPIKNQCMRPLSISATKPQIPPPRITNAGTTPVGEYRYHYGIKVISCNKTGCIDKQCNNVSNTTPNLCGVPIATHETGNVPSASPNGANMTTELVGNLTSNPVPMGVPPINVVPLSAGVNATGQLKDQYAVMEKSVINTTAPSEPKLNAYMQQASVSTGIIDNLPSDSNVNKIPTLP